MRLRVFISTTLAVLAAAILPTAAAAQATGGVLGGVNLANIDFSAENISIDFQRRTGAIAGAFVRYDFREGVGLQIEGLFSQKGAKNTDDFDFDGDGLPDELDVLVNTLEIPILAHFGVRAGDNATVRLFGGPAFAYKLSDTQKVDGVELSDDEAIEFKSFDVGITVGAGLDIRQFLVDVRYTFGLVNVNDDPDPDLSPIEIKNRVFSVMIGFRFR